MNDLASISSYIDFSLSRQLEQLKDLRLLYWAKRYHLNTRKEIMKFGRGTYFLFDLYCTLDKQSNVVVEKSVQCGLSELFTVLAFLEAAEKGFAVMYVLPSHPFRDRFVNNRINALHSTVDFYRQKLRESCTHIYRKDQITFGKGTLFFIGSNVENAFLELPADSIFIDELDRCEFKNIAKAPDRLVASKHGYQREISNPTVDDFGIDSRFRQSSQALYHIKCDSCNEWFTPDFFKHVVYEHEPGMYLPRDRDAKSDEDISLMHTCGRPVDRLKKGEWVHTYPTNTWKGYRVSRLFSQISPKDTLRNLYRLFQESFLASYKTQIFYNSVLGLPYSDADSKIDAEALNACQSVYKFPCDKVSASNKRFMGIDVGKNLHVVLRERIGNEEDGVYLKMVSLGIYRSFEDVAEQIRIWRPNRVVIDSQPETHKVAELQKQFRSVLSATFERKHHKLFKVYSKDRVVIDRTTIIDAVKEHVDRGIYINPSQENPLLTEYHEHMKAAVRLFEPDEKNPDNSRYVWKEGSNPDHFLLAEAYCLMASMCLPHRDAIDFYLAAQENQRKELTEMHKETSVAALLRKPQRVSLPKTIDYEEQTIGYVDVAALLSRRDCVWQENEIVDVLKQKGFIESVIKGQWIKEEVKEGEK